MPLQPPLKKQPQIAKFMGPTWGPLGFCRPQMGPVLGRQDPDGPHIGPMNFAICGCFFMPHEPYYRGPHRKFRYFRKLAGTSSGLGFGLEGHPEQGTVFLHLRLATSRVVPTPGSFTPHAPSLYVFLNINLCKSNWWNTFWGTNYETPAI